MTRFTLDANVLIYAVEPGERRQPAAARLVEAAALSGRGALTIQALGEFFHAATRKGKLNHATAAAHVARLLALFPGAIAASEGALAAAMRAAASRRLSYWDALLLATAAEAGCAAVLSEDMAPGAELAGARVVPAFDGTNPHPDALALLAG